MYINSLKKNNRISIIKEFELLSSSKYSEYTKRSNNPHTKYLQNYLQNNCDNCSKKKIFDSLTNDISVFFNSKIKIQSSKIKLDKIIIPYLLLKFNTVKYYSNDLNLLEKYSINYDFYIFNMNLDDDLINQENIIYYINNIDTISNDNIQFLRKNNKPFIIDLNSKIHNLSGFRIINFPEYDIDNHIFDLREIINLWSVLKYNNIFQS